MDNKQSIRLELLKLMASLDTPKNLFAHYFSNLDIVGLNSILDPQKRYDGITKREYLNYIKSIFEIKKSEKISKLESQPIVCLGCKNGCTGFLFSDESNKQYYTLILDENDSHVIDMKECSKFDVDKDLDGYKYSNIREFPVF